jgi:chromosome segregation ATPase
MRTIEDFQKELAAKDNDLRAANDLLSNIQTQITALSEQNSQLKIEKENFLNALKEIKAENVNLAEKLSAASSEIEVLKKQEREATTKAIELMAQVGQPKPVTQAVETNKTSEISKLNGLAKVQAAFKAQSQGIKKIRE